MRRVLTSQWGRRALVLSAVVVSMHTMSACGGASPAAPTSDPTITITASGVTPTELHIAAFTHVTFFNNDTRPHAMNSDPVQVHTDCPAINDVGFLNPGERGSTGALYIKRTCGFHDHINENDPIFKGRIIIE
jgi:hypothetical protein